MARKHEWPRISKRGSSFQVDCGNDPQTGKRLRCQFPTRDEAEQFAKDQREARKEVREVARFERRNRAVRLAGLTDSQRGDVLEAYRLLNGRGTLTQAVRWYLKHAAPADGKTVADTYAELLAAVEAANRRPRTVQELRTRLSGFVDEFGKSAVASVTAPDIEAWIQSRCKGLSARTRDHFRRVLHRLFQFATKRGYRDGNPVAALEKPHAEETNPEILRPADVRKLLAAAASDAGADEPPRSAELRKLLVPHLAIAFFAGLRTSELLGLDWKNVDLARRQIFVDPKTAKKRRARYVQIEPNLVAWLAPHREADGPVFFSRRALRYVQDVAKVDIPHNGARHSYGSYHLAAFEDAGRTSAQLGHSEGASVLFNHYRALVTPEDAREYWRIEPAKDGSNVLNFPKVAAG